MSGWLLATRLLRLALTATLWAMVAVVVAVGGGARLAPLTGHELLAIRSGSMAPAMPVGAMAAVDTSAAAEPRPGDAIAFRLPSGHVVVHRFVELAADGESLVTKGDANAAVDPWPVPPDRLLGVVTWQVPAAGYLLGMLGMLTGVLAVLAMAGAVWCTIWLLEDLEWDLRAEAEAAPAAAAPQGRRRAHGRRPWVHEGNPSRPRISRPG